MKFPTVVKVRDGNGSLPSKWVVTARSYSICQMSSHSHFAICGNELFLFEFPIWDLRPLIGGGGLNCSTT
ncbi:hypothetical protein TNCV_4428171 [Trichonephila clavipes]|nr:hypothetical protein TNCV_4428171 [Trichonephila clavipes]